VSQRAKKRGLPQMGTLGAGNHYAEIQARMLRAVLCCRRVALTSASQVVDEIFDTWAANKMGIDRIGQVCVMIHSGSRGLGHQARALGGAGSPRVVISSPDATREPRWPPTRWLRWRPQWRVTASTPTTGSLHARASTPRRARITWCGTPLVNWPFHVVCQRAFRPGAEHAPTGGDGVRRQLRVGEPQLDDVSVQTGTPHRHTLRISTAPGMRPDLPAAQAFAKMFTCTPDDLDMHVVYDVSHNIAKARPALPQAAQCAAPGMSRLSAPPAQVEEHVVDGRVRTLLVHRKVRPRRKAVISAAHHAATRASQGSTRAFPPHHPLIPVDYQFTGQPVMIGGTMARRAAAVAARRAADVCLLQGTCSYVLTGTEKGMQETFGR
jgi:hypothetical protein